MDRILNKTTGRLSRREFLRHSVLAGLAVGASSILAACAPQAAPAPTTAPVQPTEAPTTAPAEATEAPAAQATEVPTAAPASSGAVTLRFVTNHGESDVPLFQHVIKNFMDKYPDIKIDHLDIAGNEFYDTINTQAAGGGLPDVWYTRTFDVPVYASRKWTISLQSLVERDAAEVNVDDFWPAEVAQMKWNGELYALPYDFSNIGIYYNKAMFASNSVDLPPDKWTWPDLVTLALKFVKKENGEFSAWGLQFYNWDWVFMGLLFGWGGKIWTDDFSQCVIDSPENRDCFQFFVDARNQGVYPEAGATPQGVDPFAAGLLAMSFQGSWATTYMRDQIKDKFDFDVTAMPLSPKGNSCINAAGGAWGIAATSKNQEAAWKFNKFLTSTESTNILISEPLRSIPGRQSSVPLWEQKAAEGGMPPKNVEVFAKQMQGANAVPYPPYWRDFETAWNNQIAPLLDGTVKDKPETVLANFQSEVNRIISQSKGS